MEVVHLDLAGPKLVKPHLHTDARGCFLEAYQQQRYQEHGIGTQFIQDNHSVSNVGCLRGLHFQKAPEQVKLVRVALGKIYDVVVDVRPASPTFGRWAGVQLDGSLHHQLLVPDGFAHGFVVLEGPAHVMYKVSSPYRPQDERSIVWNDPQLNIRWPTLTPLLSERDHNAPTLAQLMAQGGL